MLCAADRLGSNAASEVHNGGPSSGLRVKDTTTLMGEQIALGPVAWLGSGS